MSKYLIKTVETYRVDSEAEAKQLIEEAKEDHRYNLTRYLTEHRERKSKGEIEDEWKRVTLTKNFNEEKDADIDVTITYEF